MIKRIKLPQNHLFAELVLVFVTILWGTTFVLVQHAMDSSCWGDKTLTPNTLITYRFTICVLLMLAWKPKMFKQISHKELFGGILLGVLLYIAFLSQTIGLGYTTTTRSGFITSLSVLFVPFLSIVIEKKIPKWNSLVGCFLALIGLYYLLEPFSETAGINKGDLFTLICAASWGLYIVVVSFYTEKSINLFPFIFMQFFSMTILCWIFVGISGDKIIVPQIGLTAIVLYLGIFCTFLTTLLQNLFQKNTTSTRAALIFCAEPLVVAIIAYIFLHEFSNSQIIGGLIILSGVIFAEIF